MDNYNQENACNIESLVSIFMAEKGNLKVLLKRKETDPYKGYWCLPYKELNINETLEDSITDCIYEQTGIKTLNIKQCYTFSAINRMIDNRVVAVSYIGLIDQITLITKQEQLENVELEWFSIDKLPKLAFDHEEILKKNIESLKGQIININTLKCLFPSDFSIPEIQKLYENLLNIDIDRRNFRKKLLNLNIIESTNEITDGATGRPAKLYRFKDNVKDITLI